MIYSAGGGEKPCPLVGMDLSGSWFLKFGSVLYLTPTEDHIRAFEEGIRLRLYRALVTLVASALAQAIAVFLHAPPK